MRKVTAFLACLAALWLALPAVAAAPTVVLGNSTLELAPGQTASLPVAVTDVQDLYGLEIHLRFDPAVIQVADADLGRDGIQVAAGSFLSADFVAQNQADNQAGSIDYAVTQTNPNEPKSGSGTLLVIQFQGSAAGRVSQLEVTNGILTTRDGELIPVTFANGEVRVTGASAVGGRDTATPEPDPVAVPVAATVPAPLEAPLPSSSSDDNAAPTAAGAPATTQASGATPPAQLPATTVGVTSLSAATQENPPAVASPTPGPSISGTAAVPVVGTSSPSAQPAEARMSDPTPGTGVPTPALVAKISSGSPGKAILEPGSSGKSGAVEPAPEARQPASRWLLIGAAALICLAGIVAAVSFGLLSRRGRA